MCFVCNINDRYTTLAEDMRMQRSQLPPASVCHSLSHTHSWPSVMETEPWCVHSRGSGAIMRRVLLHNNVRQARLSTGALKATFRFGKVFLCVPRAVKQVMPSFVVTVCECASRLHLRRPRYRSLIKKTTEKLQMTSLNYKQHNNLSIQS